MRDGPAICQFTSSATAADVSLNIGYVPHMVIALYNVGGASPNQRVWVDAEKFDQWPDANGTILTTGTTGATSLDADSIARYAGGDKVSATDVTNRRYIERTGEVVAEGKVTTPGIFIPAGDQVDSGVNIILCFRDDIN